MAILIHLTIYKSYQNTVLVHMFSLLQALGFELNTKVNLSELSVLLEQELLNADEQNFLLQAATASYQQEMRNVKYVNP